MDAACHIVIVACATEIKTQSFSRWKLAGHNGLARSLLIVIKQMHEMWSAGVVFLQGTVKTKTPKKVHCKKKIMDILD